MANIAHVRRFDGTDDIISVADGALANSMEPFTFATIFQPRLASTKQRILFANDPFTYNFMQHEFNGLAISNQDFNNNYSNNNDITAATGIWYLLAVTKTAGTTTPRFHVYDFNSTTWNHYDSTSGTITAFTAPSSTAEWYIGGYTTPAEQLSADLAVVGIWYGTALSDANIETLETSIANWDSLSPTACWLFNQESTATSVTDRTGNGADETSKVGTTVVTPSGLTFEVSETSVIAPTIRTVASPMRW